MNIILQVIDVIRYPMSRRLVAHIDFSGAEWEPFVATTDKSVDELNRESIKWFQQWIVQHRTDDEVRLPGSYRSWDEVKEGLRICMSQLSAHSGGVDAVPEPPLEPGAEETPVEEEEDEAVRQEYSKLAQRLIAGEEVRPMAQQECVEVERCRLLPSHHQHTAHDCRRHRHPRIKSNPALCCLV